jgi:hypothetical protein
MPFARERACAIITAFDQAQAELVGKAVVLTDGKAGTVDNIWLDELHGLRIFDQRSRRQVARLNHKVGTDELTSLRHRRRARDPGWLRLLFQ